MNTTFEYKGRRVEILPGYSNTILRVLINGKTIDAGKHYKVDKAECRTKTLIDIEDEIPVNMRRF